MEELPENTAPQSRPEDEAETAPAAAAARETPPEPDRESEGKETKSPADEAAPEQATAQTERPDRAEQAGEDSGSPTAAAEPEQPAAETAAPPDAQVDGPEKEGDEAPQPNLDELEVTASGAIMVPGQEAPRAEEPRPKKAPVKPERPTGPRITDLRPGQVVDGTVTRIEKYGAFVNLGLVDRRDGLIHISELSPHRIRRVEDVVQVGAPVRARVVSVDLGRGRIALSLNDVDAETAKEASVGPAEPAMTSMQAAFADAQNRQREAREKGTSLGEGKQGDKKKREQEELMRRLQEGQ